MLSSFSFASFQLARLDRAGLPVFTAPAGRLLGLIDWEGRACVAAPRICPPRRSRQNVNLFLREP